MLYSKSISFILLHLANTRFGDYYAGMFHLLSGTEFILMMLVFGIATGQQNARTARHMLVSFSLAIILGGITGLFFTENPILSVLCFSCCLILGLAVALRIKIPYAAYLSLAIVQGFLLGLANGAAWERGFLPQNYLGGVMVTAICIVLLISGFTIGLKQNWQIITVRVIGSWVAAISLMYLPFILFNT